MVVDFEYVALQCIECIDGNVNRIHSAGDIKIPSGARYNLLRRIGQELVAMRDVLPVKVTVARRRLCSVLQDVMYVGCRCAETARRHVLHLGLNSAWVLPFQRLYARL